MSTSYDVYNASITEVLYEISCYIGPRYNALKYAHSKLIISNVIFSQGYLRLSN